MWKVLDFITIIPWLGMVFVNTRCNSVLLIEKTKPAAVKVSNHQWKVVALNRFNPDLLPFARDKKTAAFHNGAQHAFAGVLDAILADNTYSLEFADSAAYRAASSGEKLTPEQVLEGLVPLPAAVVADHQRGGVYVVGPSGGRRQGCSSPRSHSSAAGGVLHSPG